MFTIAHSNYLVFEHVLEMIELTLFIALFEHNFFFFLPSLFFSLPRTFYLEMMLWHMANEVAATLKVSE